MKAFIAHSFSDKDIEIVEKIKKFIESSGIECFTGEEALNKSIADKVKKRIKECEIFVGLFTINSECYLKGGFSGLFNREKKYITSNWLFQESGYAIGCEKELIFIVEKGISDFPELQGDLELIYFERESLDKPYLRINQMIKGIKSSLEKQEKVGILGEKETKKGHEDIKEEKEVKTENKNVGFRELIDLLMVEKDYKSAQDKFIEVSKDLDEKEKGDWESYILYHSSKLGDKTAFDRLKSLASRSKENPRVMNWVAMLYYDMREYYRAYEIYINESELYNKNIDEQKEDLIGCYSSASKCLAKDGQITKAYKFLLNLLNDNEFKDNKALIFEKLAYLAKANDDAERFGIYAEGSLDLNPNNGDLRFNLAYHYSNISKSGLSLLHYKKLIQSDFSPMAYNNMGVAYDEFELKCKSVMSYEKAKDSKVTLAMSNLANKYIKEGFIDEAKNLLNKANKLSTEGIEVSRNVGKSLNSINEILKNENKNEESLLLESDKERKFWIDYCDKYTTEEKITMSNIEGNWKTRWGHINIVFDEIKYSFIVNETIEVEDKYFTLFMKGKPEEEKVYYFDRKIEINCKCENLTGSFDAKIYDKRLSSEDFELKEKSKGFLIFDSSYKSIRVMEERDGKIIEYYNWEKRIKLDLKKN